MVHGDGVFCILSVVLGFGYTMGKGFCLENMAACPEGLIRFGIPRHIAQETMS